MTLYNEFEPFPAQWLRNLMAAGHISGGAGGNVDERSIKDLQSADLQGYDRVHLFAGVGGWDYALRLAGWPDEVPVWTGSCPCQPFSCAGKGRGEADERHLWPEMFRLIKARRPGVVFGEQVASKAGCDWNAGVYADLESIGYEVPKDADGGYLLFIIPACGVGAPHRRYRLFWVADNNSKGQPQRVWNAGNDGTEERPPSGQAIEPESIDVPLGLPAGVGRDERRAEPGRPVGPAAASSASPAGISNIPGPDSRSAAAKVAGHGDTIEPTSGGIEPAAHDERKQEYQEQRESDEAEREWGSIKPSGCGAPDIDRPWSHYSVIRCADGKARRIAPEPALFPLAHGLPGRVGRLRSAGNAIVPQVAAEFIKAYMAARG